MKKVAVKYCGGCNPHFDRAALTARLFNDVPQLEVADPGTEQPWFTLVVCGCSRACAASHPAYGTQGKAVLCSEAEYGKLRERLAIMAHDT